MISTTDASDTFPCFDGALCEIRPSGNLVIGNTNSDTNILAIVAIRFTSSCNILQVPSPQKHTRLWTRQSPCNPPKAPMNSNTYARFQRATLIPGYRVFVSQVNFRVVTPVLTCTLRLSARGRRRVKSPILIAYLYLSQQPLPHTTHSNSSSPPTTSLCPLNDRAGRYTRSEFSIRFPSDLVPTCFRRMSQFDHGDPLWFVTRFFPVFRLSECGHKGASSNP